MQKYIVYNVAGELKRDVKKHIVVDLQNDCRTFLKKV